MKTGLGGHRIALLEARLAGPLAELVRRKGGEPVCVPAVRERRNHLGDLMAALLYTLQAEPDPVLVFTTVSAWRRSSTRRARSRSSLCCATRSSAGPASAADQSRWRRCTAR